MARPRKIKYPAAWEEWLRCFLRKKRPEDRMKIFREWRRMNLKAHLKRLPTEQELESDIKEIRETKFNEVEQFCNWGESLKDFVEVFAKANRTKKAYTAATIRWSRKVKKTL